MFKMILGRRYYPSKLNKNLFCYMPGGAGGAGDTAADSPCPHGALSLGGKVDPNTYEQMG